MVHGLLVAAAAAVRGSKWVREEGAYREQKSAVEERNANGDEEGGHSTQKKEL